MRTWWNGFKRMIAVLFGRAPSKWPAPSRRPDQSRAERIVAEHIAHTLRVGVMSVDGGVVVPYGWDGRSVKLPLTVWNSHRSVMIDSDRIACNSWEGFGHECWHSVRAQLGVLDPFHTMKEDWGTVVDNKFSFDGGNVMETQRRLREGGFAP